MSFIPSTLIQRCLALGLLLGITQAQAATQEYLLTVTHPNQLQVIDTTENKVARTCDVPGTFGSGSLATSPDGKIAYVLTNKWEDVYGIQIEDCKIVFSAKQSTPATDKTPAIQVKTIISMTLSADGKELYTVQNPVKKLADRYETMEPRLAVFDTSAGENAKPIRTFPIDRRITRIAYIEDTKEVVYASGDLKAIEVNSGKIRTLKKLQTWDRSPEKWAPPDAFLMFSVGEHVNEFILPYITVKWKGEPGDQSNADFIWGIVRTNLKTGAIEEFENLPVEFIVFNWITDPEDNNILYGSFNNLSKHSLKEGKVLQTEDLHHTFYNINMTSNGTLYLGGTSSDISVHDKKTLKQIATIQLSGDMSSSDLRLVKVTQ